MSAICKAMPNPERVFFWTSSGNEIPAGRRLGWSCAVPYCGKYEHMAVAENKNSQRSSWSEYASRVASLQIGEFIDLEDTQIDKKFINNLRSALFMSTKTRSVKFLVHRLPWGGVRLIKTGTSPTYWNGFEPEKDCGREFNPPSRHRVETYQRPPVLWLGLLANSSLNVKNVRKSSCSVKACPLPAINNGQCYHHAHFFDYPVSMTDNKIDWNPHYRTGYDANQTPELYSEFLVSTASLEKSLRVERGGYVREDHKNQGDSDVLADEFDHERDKKNALIRHNKARSKSEIRARNIDIVTDEFLLEAARRSTSNRERNSIRMLVNFVPEPRIEYAPEERAVNYQGRGTRGGHPGGHKKIRKSQRKRPAGWHGSRPKHDVFKRWDRETLEVSCDQDCDGAEFYELETLEDAELGL